MDSKEKLFLPRHTGEVPPKGAEGEGNRENLEDFRSEIARTSSVAFPLRPCGPPPPYDGGGKRTAGRLYS
jgi:hypothetical protein